MREPCENRAVNLLALTLAGTRRGPRGDSGDHVATMWGPSGDHVGPVGARCFPLPNLVPTLIPMREPRPSGDRVGTNGSHLTWPPPGSHLVPTRFPLGYHLSPLGPPPGPHLVPTGPHLVPA